MQLWINYLQYIQQCVQVVINFKIFCWRWYLDIFVNLQFLAWLMQNALDKIYILIFFLYNSEEMYP